MSDWLGTVHRLFNTRPGTVLRREFAKGKQWRIVVTEDRRIRAEVWDSGWIG